MIEISNLVKRHGGRTVVDDLSFCVGPGQVTGFLGPNGAGKSSTLRILLGLDRSTSGTALVNGVPYRNLDRPLWKVGAMLDGPGAHKGHTARAHLRWVAQSNTIPGRRVDEVLELAGLSEAATTRIGRLSLGMGQRLGIATALLGDPDILVLDEPTNGLDPSGIRWMRQLLQSLAREGKTILVSSHLMSEMEHVAHNFVVIARGRAVAVGTPEEVLRNHSSLEQAFFELTDIAVQTRAAKPTDAPL